MNCTDAYREALTRGLSSAAASTPASTPASTSAPSQRQAAEPDREGVVARPLRLRTNPRPHDLGNRVVEAGGAAAESGPEMALVMDATVVNSEAIDQR